MSDIKPTRDWYKWKPRHFQSDVRLLSDGAELLYRRLLDEYWISAKLVQNERILQALCKYSARKWSRYWPEIKHYFVQNGEYLIHRKMEEQLAQAVDNSEKSRHAANIRWAKEESERNANAYANADPNAMPRARKETETETETEPPYIPPRGKSASADQFDQFWKVCLRKVGKKKAQQKWKTLQCNKIAGDIIAAMKDQNTYMFQFREITKVPHPATWLHGECWNDQVVSEKPKPRLPSNYGDGYDQPPPRAQPPDGNKYAGFSKPFSPEEREKAKKKLKEARGKMSSIGALVKQAKSRIET